MVFNTRIIDVGAFIFMVLTPVCIHFKGHFMLNAAQNAHRVIDVTLS
jgi:hypothetical protein